MSSRASQLVDLPLFDSKSSSQFPFGKEATLEVTLNLREIGLLQPDLLQFHFSKGMEIIDAPASDDELC